MSHTTMKPIGFCKPDPIQAKRHAGTEAHRQLIDSIRRHGILQPPGVRPSGEAVWGTGRILAAIAAGLTEIPVVILDRPMTEAEYGALTLTENLIRADLTPIEQVDGVEEFARLNPGLPNKELAERLSLNPSVVTRLRAIAACPIAHEALADGRLKGISDAYTVAKAPDAQKAELLALRQSGASRDQIDQAARKQRKAATPQVRAKRILCPLPSGVSVTVSGQELSLDDLIEALGEAQKEAKKAREQNLDVKTWQNVMRDKSRAG
jgi:ParB family chromosome partitioning protein